MNDQLDQSNVYLKCGYVSGLHMKILVKLEKHLISREEIINVMRKLRKSHDGLIHFDMEEFICE